MEKVRKTPKRWPPTRILAVLLFCLALLFSGGRARPAHAGLAGFIVNDPGDASDISPGDGICDSDGGTLGDQCTLRAAIEEANDFLGPDGINFNLTSAPYIITTTSALPTITETVIIDGTTQPDFAGDPIIQLNGASGAWDGLRIDADDSQVHGLVIRNFLGDGIEISAAGGGAIIRGNYIGTSLDGSSAEPNSVGIRIIDSPGNLIGGTAEGHLNVISGNTGAGIIVNGVDSIGNTVWRNYIGVNAGGGAALGNGSHGILIDAAVNTVVGSNSSDRVNIISANDGSGVLVTNGASGTKLLGNRIGTNYGRTLDLGNGAYGVKVETSSVTIGGTVAGAVNYIYHNVADGIAVSDAATQVVMLRNSLFNNGGLGIDLADDGVTFNDLTDPDGGENDLQNFPVISSALIGGTNLQIVGGFNSLPNESFRLEFFFGDDCDATGYGEGGRFIKAMKVTTDALGNYSIDTTFTANVDVGDYITSTATFLDGGTTPQNTSEYSACWPVSAAPTPTPTQTNTPAPTATSSGGGGGTINTPTRTPWPTPTITGTPPTATPIPTWTPNNPEKTLTALASPFAPTHTSTFSPYITTSTNTPFPTATFDPGQPRTPSATPTSRSLLTSGEMTATAEGFFGQIAGINTPTLALWCVVPVVLLLLGIGGIQLMNWINARREIGGIEE